MEPPERPAPQGLSQPEGTESRKKGKCKENMDLLGYGSSRGLTDFYGSRKQFVGAD